MCVHLFSNKRKNAELKDQVESDPVHLVTTKVDSDRIDILNVKMTMAG